MKNKTFPVCVVFLSLLLGSCNNKETQQPPVQQNSAYSEYVDEMKLLLHDKKPDAFVLDTCSIRAYKDHFYEIQYSIHVNNWDTGTKQTYQYLPILAAQEEVTFIEFPADKKFKVIAIASNTDRHYYLAAFPSAFVIKKQDSSHRAVISLRYLIKADPKENESLKIPMLYHPHETVFNIYNREGSSLENPEISLGYNNDSGAMQKYPDNYYKGEIFYTQLIKTGTDEIAGIHFSKQSLSWRFILTLILSSLVIFAFVMIIRQQQKDNEFIKKEEKIREENELSINASNQAEIFLKKPLNSIRYQKQLFIWKMLIIAGFIALFLLLILLSSTIQAQTNQAPLRNQYIVNDLQATIAPSGFNNDNYQYQCHLKFLLIASKDMDSIMPVRIRFGSYCKHGKSDQAGSKLDDMDSGYLFTILPTNITKVDGAIFELYQTTQLDNKSIKLLDSIQKDQPYSSIDFTFTECIYTARPELKLHAPLIDSFTLEAFPFDQATIRIPISINHRSLFSSLEISKSNEYASSMPTVDLPQFGFKEYKKVFMANHKRYIVENQQLFTVTSQLQRYPLQRKWYPIALLVLTITLPVALVFWKRLVIGLKLVTGLFGLTSLAGLVKFFMEEMDVSPAKVVQPNHQLSVADILVFGALLVAILLFWILSVFKKSAKTGFKITIFLLFLVGAGLVVYNLYN